MLFSTFSIPFLRFLISVCYTYIVFPIALTGIPELCDSYVEENVGDSKIA
jgi:hypothetical protein